MDLKKVCTCITLNWRIIQLLKIDDCEPYINFGLYVGFK